MRHGAPAARPAASASPGGRPLRARLPLAPPTVIVTTGFCNDARSSSVCASIRSKRVGPYASSTQRTALDWFRLSVPSNVPGGASAATAARCPPADVPHRQMRSGSSPCAPAFAFSHRTAVRTSSTLAGNVIAGVRRYSIDAIANPSCAKYRLKSGPVVRVPPDHPPP